MRLQFFAAALMAVLAMASPCLALQPADVFSSDMVLQREMTVPVWGQAKAGASVTVEFAGQSKTATADAEGKWRVALDALKASEQPQTMTIRAAEDGKEQSVKFDNVLVGEVWLCSGQSNMGMSLPELPDAQEVMAAANHPQIRMLRVPEAPAEQPRETIWATWKVCSPAHAPAYSAMAYFFGRHLQEQLKTPVGLVVSAWGGSAACAWMSREALAAREISRQMPWDLVANVQLRPNTLYCGMLHPLIPLSVRGVIWYQGESDAEAPHNPYLYRAIFSGMIQDWRRAWGRPDMPFYWVQLPGLRSGRYWPVLRESQAAALALPRTGMITTVDIGQSMKLHPTNKDQFGQRMAELVLAREYGKAIAVDGPAYKSHKVEGSTVRVELEHAQGLHTADGKPPRAFEVAGEDGVFAEAEAKIEGESVTLTSSVKSPAAVRYAWAADPKVNLVNGDNLPTAPFRTDKWAVAGEEMMWQELPARATLEGRTDAESMTRGKDGWRWSGEGVAGADLEKQRMVRYCGGGAVQMASAYLPKRPAATLNWTRDAALEAAKGCTVEMRLQMFQFTAPLAGVELEVGVKQADGSVRAYRIAAAPMRLYGYAKDQVFVFGYDLDNETAFHTYRISVRPDGTAQVYLDGRQMGVLRGEPVEAKASYVAFGKRVKESTVTANLQHVAVDASGAYRP